MKTNDGGPAFPSPDTVHPNGQVQYGTFGMTLRDWFAGQALVAVIAAESHQARLDANRCHEDQVAFLQWWKEGSSSDMNDDLALACWGIADAMIAAREKGNE